MTLPHEQPLVDTLGVVEVLAWQRAHELAGSVRVEAQRANLGLDGRLHVAAMRGERNNRRDSLTCATGTGTAAAAGTAAAGTAGGGTVAGEPCQSNLRRPPVRRQRLQRALNCPLSQIRCAIGRVTPANELKQPAATARGEVAGRDKSE